MTNLDLDIEQILTAARRPWQHPVAARRIGRIRRDWLDPVLVRSEGHLRWLLATALPYSHRRRTHVALAMDCPDPRPVLSPEPEAVVAFPEVGGLHQRYERMAA